MVITKKSKFLFRTLLYTTLVFNSVVYKVFATDTPIDCIEEYTQHVVKNLEAKNRKEVDEGRRMRALIRKAWEMVPILGTEDPIASADEIDGLTPFKRRKVLEDKQAIDDLVSIAHQMKTSKESVAQIIRDTTRYQGPALCSPRGYFKRLPQFKDVKDAITSHRIQQYIAQDPRLKLVQKWRSAYKNTDGLYITGMEIEVEQGGLINAPLVDYLDLDKIYQTWHNNYPEDVEPTPPQDKLRLAKDLVKYGALIKKGRIVDINEEGKEYKIRHYPLKYANSPIFFHNVNMFWDDGAIEFNHANPYLNPADMLESMLILSYKTPFWNDVFNPQFQYEKTVSRMNFHISYNKKLPATPEELAKCEKAMNATNPDVRRVSYVFNKLLALRMVKRGIENEKAGKANDFSPFVLYKKHSISRYRAGYQNLKGILRISPKEMFNRIEVRRHYAGVSQEVQDYVRFFSSEPQKIINEFNLEMREILKDQRVLDHIFEYEPLNLLNYRHVMPYETLSRYLSQLEYDDEKFARQILDMEKEGKENDLKVGLYLASLPFTNPHPWYKNEPMKVIDVVDALVEVYGKKYTQGYHARRFCLNDESGPQCFFTDFDRSKDIFEQDVTDLPNDHKHVHH